MPYVYLESAPGLYTRHRKLERSSSIIEELRQLFEKWHQETEDLAKAHFDLEDIEGWDSDEVYASYSTLVDCATELKQIIEKYESQK